MGLREIRDDIRKKSEMQVKEADLMLHELDDLIEAYKVLEKKMKRFEKQHGDKIKNSKEYYKKLEELRVSLGLPPEIGVYSWSDSPSLMDKLSGKGYYDQLALDVLEVGKKYAKETGGILSVAELTVKVNKERPGRVVPPADVVKVLKSLHKNELVAAIRKLSSGVMVVEFTHVNMSEDQEEVFALASRSGYITLEDLIIRTGWNMDRATRVLSELEREGLAIKDADVAEGTKYWFPSLG